MEDNSQLSFWLLPSPDEFWKTEPYQLELEEFERQTSDLGDKLRITPAYNRLKTLQNKIDYEIRCEELLSGGRGVFGFASAPLLSGEFVVEFVKTLSSLGLGGIIGAWIQARHGRKVRVKVDEIEVEANTSEEVEKLLAKAVQIQLQKEPKRIQ